MKITWPLMGIAEERLKISLEPWAGHISGSPAKILLLWEVLLNEYPLLSYPSNAIGCSTIK